MYCYVQVIFSCFELVKIYLKMNQIITLVQLKLLEYLHCMMLYVLCF